LTRAFGVPSWVALCLEAIVTQPADLRARFDAEVLAADVAVPPADLDSLFAMWIEHLPLRDSLRAASVALEEEPSFTQKPAQAGAGVVTPAGGGGVS
jgi:hypothetical protein